ncbi:unnamed protein product [Schistocephalus solidus]|uniref:ALOG domain-containing protein n=1 Tax=Schistocephalus solidus TaxID=70667 RepID=A0A183T1E3_SCHSO|nr:unnamed protein product [Schistocephalus solidus]
MDSACVEAEACPARLHCSHTRQPHTPHFLPADINAQALFTHIRSRFPVPESYVPCRHDDGDDYGCYVGRLRDFQTRVRPRALAQLGSLPPPPPPTHAWHLAQRCTRGAGMLAEVAIVCQGNHSMGGGAVGRGGSGGGSGSGVH